MGLSVVHGSPQRMWVPVEPAETIYTGALIGVDIATPLEGVRPLPVAAGNANTTNKDIPFGVCVGNNNVSSNIVYNSTQKAEYITQVAAGSVYGSTTQYQGVEGVWAKGDPQAMVQVDVITPSTVLRAPIFNNAVGTAPTVVTVTTGCGGDGIGCTTGSADAATNANWATLYMRSGANMGIYRTLTSSSATVHTWLKAMPNTISIGDTAVVINGLRPYGPSRVYIDAEGLYVDCSETLDTNYLYIHVLRLDLSEPGNEYVEFRFDTDNFCATRA